MLPSSSSNQQNRTTRSPPTAKRPQRLLLSLTIVFAVLASTVHANNYSSSGHQQPWFHYCPATNQGNNGDISIRNLNINTVKFLKESADRVTPVCSVDPNTKKVYIMYQSAVDYNKKQTAHISTDKYVSVKMLDTTTNILSAEKKIVDGAHRMYEVSSFYNTMTTVLSTGKVVVAWMVNNNLLTGTWGDPNRYYDWKLQILNPDLSNFTEPFELVPLPFSLNYQESLKLKALPNGYFLAYFMSKAKSGTDYPTIKIFNGNTGTTARTTTSFRTYNWSHENCYSYFPIIDVQGWRVLLGYHVPLGHHDVCNHLNKFNETIEFRTFDVNPTTFELTPLFPKEVRVNDHDGTNDYCQGALTANSKFAFFVWHAGKDEINRPGTEEDIYGQIFNAETGERVGKNFLINIFTLGNQQMPWIASFGNRFAVVWQDQFQRSSGGGVLRGFELDDQTGAITYKSGERFFKGSSATPSWPCFVNDTNVVVPATSAGNTLISPTMGEGIFVHYPLFCKEVPVDGPPPGDGSITQQPDADANDDDDSSTNSTDATMLIIVIVVVMAAGVTILFSIVSVVRSKRQNRNEREKEGENDGVDGSQEDERKTNTGGSSGDSRSDGKRSQRWGSSTITGRSSAMSGSTEHGISGSDGSRSTTMGGSLRTPLQNLKGPIHFKKGKLLGTGGFGRVFLGLDGNSGTLMAAKELTFSPADPETTKHLKRLKEEIAFMKRLDHPNVVQYLGGDRKGTTFYILMEYVPGGSLWSLLQEFQAFNEAVAADFTRQATAGLAYIHKQSIVHRDLKSMNILVGVSGVAKIADFGSARNLETVSGISGTPNWMAPEVVRGDEVNVGAPADVWSLGCTVMEMFTNEIPWKAFGTSPAVMVKVAMATDSWVEEHVPACVTGLGRSFILQCLRVNPKDRPTAEQLMAHPFLTTAFDDVVDDRQVTPHDDEDNGTKIVPISTPAPAASGDDSSNHQPQHNPLEGNLIMKNPLERQPDMHVALVRSALFSLRTGDGQNDDDDDALSVERRNAGTMDDSERNEISIVCGGVENATQAIMEAFSLPHRPNDGQTSVSGAGANGRSGALELPVFTEQEPAAPSAEPRHDTTSSNNDRSAMLIKKTEEQLNALIQRSVTNMVSSHNNTAGWDDEDVGLRAAGEGHLSQKGDVVITIDE